MDSSDMWRELNTPDAFKRDWYGELTNQCSHTLLGLVMALVVVAVWREASGSMPHRWLAFAVLSLGYGAFIEWKIQRWKPGDSWFDWLMVSFGLAAAILPFREVIVTDPGTLVAFDHREAFVILTLWAVCLGTRVRRRYIRQRAT